MSGERHVPVLLGEVLDLLRPKPGGRYADLTLGAGGHAEALLEASAPDGRLIGFDRDPSAIELATARLERFGDRFEAVCANFGGAPKLLAQHGWDEVDGILMDLGVSSMQLDDPERGFGFRHDAPLDMRMSGRGKVTAESLLATASREELETWFRDWGEEKRAREIAERIVDLRLRTRLKTTRELAELVRSVTGTRGKIHPATRVFQALRIAVNRELEALESALPGLVERLKPGGRLAVISFHSLEDRIVKDAFRREEEAGRGRTAVARPITPGSREVDANRRSRSAKLRGLERT